MADRFILGDNSFLGVDHLSQERARARDSTLTTQRIIGAITLGLRIGAQGLATSSHPIMRSVLSEMKMKTHEPFSSYLIVPDVTSYVRLASGGVLNLGTEILSNLSAYARASALLRGGLSFAMSDTESLFRLLLDSEIETYKRAAPRTATLRCVLLHEILTDIMLALHATKLLEIFYDQVYRRHGLNPGFVTRNFADFAPLAHQLGLDKSEVCIMTPFNAAGFQMTPSRESCEEALSTLRNARVLAMSTLAAGYLTPNEAAGYLKEQRRLDGFIIGASSEPHLRETLGIFSRELSG